MTRIHHCGRSWEAAEIEARQVRLVAVDQPDLYITITADEWALALDIGTIREEHTSCGEASCSRQHQSSRAK